MAEKVMGYVWTPLPFKPSKKVLVLNGNTMDYVPINPNHSATYYVPRFSMDIDAAWRIDERMDQLGRRGEYLDALEAVLGIIDDADHYMENQWRFLRASPWQRCDAALRVFNVTP